MPDVTYLTAEGLEKLKIELEELKGPGRLRIAQRLRIAIQQGDLSENADYTATKEEQGFMEGRIQDIEHMLRNIVIIDESKHKRDVVDIGARVTVQEEDFPPEEYQMVGPREADPRKARISHESPIGKAILGRKVGDVINADTPTGSIQLKILKIE